jgi:hypothetical protein
VLHEYSCSGTRRADAFICNQKLKQGGIAARRLAKMHTAQMNIAHRKSAVIENEQLPYVLLSPPLFFPDIVGAAT